MLIRKFTLLCLSFAMASAGDLTYLADAVNPGNGKVYKAYIDQSTIHREGVYESVKVVSIYDQPITAAGFTGVKSMVNIFQMHCGRKTKRVTYIGFLDTAGQVIVEEKYPDAKEELLGAGTVDQKIASYLCVNLSDPVR
jgi:hypothetical protein